MVLPLSCSYEGEHTCLKGPHMFSERTVDMGMDEAVAVDTGGYNANRTGREWSGHICSSSRAAEWKNQNGKS